MILITGCNGSLGSQLAESLIKEGQQVKGYIRPGADLSLVSPAIQNKIKWCEGTLFDAYALGNALEDVEKVIHTAAVVSFAPSRRKEMFRTNVEGTAALVNESLASGVKQFIHISSIAALGRPSDKSSIDETDLWVESENNTHYAKSKYLAELEVYRGFEEGLNGFVLNPSVILCPGDIEKSSTKLFGYVLKGGAYYTTGDLNYVDVRDVCAILIELMKQPASGERFVLNGGKVSYKYFLDQVAQEFQKTPPQKLASTWKKELIWRIEYLRSLLSGAEPLITKETARLSGNHYQYDNQKIKTLLSYDFRTIDDTIHWVCEELRKQPAVHNLL
jgi:dihydroflavonol-4-reductase